MKKNYVIEDKEISCEDGVTYRLDAHGYDKEGLLDTAQIATVDDDGDELNLQEFAEVAEWLQEKAMKVIDKELKDE